MTEPLSAASTVVDREQFREWFHDLGRQNHVPPHVIDWCWQDFDSRHLWVIPAAEATADEAAAEREQRRYPEKLVESVTRTIELRFVRERVAMVRTFLSIKIELYRLRFGDWTSGRA